MTETTFPECIDVAWCQANGHVHLFDANGEQIKHATRANLRTGVVEQFSMDENGLHRLNAAMDTVLREERCYPAPLRAEFINRA